MPAAVGDLTKVVAVFVAAAYVVGLSTTSLYLQRLHIAAPDPGALRARYVYSGAVELLVAGTIFAGLAYGRMFVRHAPTHTVGRFGVAAMFGVVPLAVVAVFLARVADEAPLDAVEDTLAAAVAATACGYCVVVVFRTVTQPPQGTALPPWTLVVGIGMLGVVFAAGFVWRFTVAAFPYLPQQFGGAREERTHLVVAGDGAQALAAVGVRVGCAGRVSDDVWVVFDAGDSVVVRTGAGRYVALDAALVSGTSSAGCGA